MLCLFLIFTCIFAVITRRVEWISTSKISSGRKQKVF